MSKSNVALITGSGRGIGKSIALHVSKLGYDVVINYRFNQQEAEAVAAAVRANGQKAACIKADVGEPEDVGVLRATVEKEFGQLDLLVNNAGAIIRPGAWNEISNEDLLATVKVNLLGPIYVIREFAPLLKRSGNGNIINISSTYSYNGAAPVLAYTSSKAGINSMTKAMALELAKDGIRVNAIAPGNFETDMTNSGGEALREWIISTTPLKRLGKPTEIGACIEFFLNAGFITGHILDIDGGQQLLI